MRGIVLLYILLWCALRSVAQQPFTRDRWYNESGTPVKTNAILQDRNGYIWLGTDEGIYRFNGRSFTFIQDSIHKPVTALAQRGHTIIAGYANGALGYLHNGAIIPLHIAGEKPVTAVTDIIADNTGTLWISTEGQGFIMVLNNTGISCDSRKGLSDDYVYNIFLFPNKRIVATTDQGINEVFMENGKLHVQNFTTQNGLPDNIVRIIRPMPDGTPCWLGTQDGGLAFYCRQSRVVWTPYIEGGWKWGAVNDILPMGGGRAWVATEDGYVMEVNTRNGDTVQVRPYYFEGKKIKRLVLGRSGIIWCATNQGITMIADEYMRYLPVPYPYRITDIRAMAIDGSDVMWYSLDDKLYRMPLHTASASQMVYQAPANITSLFADKEQRIWIGTFGKGLYYRTSSGNITAVTEIPGLKDESVLDVNGTEHNLWVSGLNGVEELMYPGAYNPRLTLVQVHNKHSGAGSDYVYQVYPDRKGRIWMATDGGGLSMYQDGRYTIWNASGLKSKVVYNVVEDSRGHIWAATLGSGLARFNGGRWQQVSLAEGLQDINISTVAANATGQVVVVHSKGFDVWYPFSGQFRTYSNRQSFIDTTSTVLKLFANDTTGNIYIPFEKGFLQVRNIYHPFDIRPNIIIGSVNVFQEPVQPGRSIFSYSDNQLSFKYEGINFASPDKLHYRYRLDGYSSDWIVTGDEAVTFPQLPPGSYTFRVQASLNNSFAGASEARYSFAIDMPFWKRPWFIILAGAVIFGIVYLYIRAREQNLKKLSSLQSERMLFEYEHLKSQVNPHFLFNSLNTLASLIEEDNRLATDYTTHLADFYRNMLAYRNKDLVLLAEEWGILQNYLYIQQSRFGNALKLETDVPRSLMQSRKIVPLALQLLVENAIKHNVVSKASPLTISIVAADDKITVKNTLNLKMSKEKGSGLGLANIKKRYNLLTDKNIYIGVSETTYTVILPLL